MGFHVHRIALVEGVVLRQQLLCVLDALVGAQHGLRETTALHLRQLVDQHVANGADFAGEAQAAAQQEGLAEGAAVGEGGKLQLQVWMPFSAASRGSVSLGRVRVPASSALKLSALKSWIVGFMSLTCAFRRRPGCGLWPRAPRWRRS